MAKNNETCIICGKQYHLCIVCERTKATWKQWKMLTDTENCYEIYKIVNDYTFKKISKTDAQDMLKNLDLTELNTFKDSVRKIIEEIMDVKKLQKVKKDEKNTEGNTKQSVE